MRSATDNPEVIQADYPGWHVWRSQMDGRPASWCATRLDESVGVDATVICLTAGLLRAELTRQRELAAQGPRARVVITR